MNGAIAVPLVSTMRPPKMTIMMKIGISQYFFRTRRKTRIREGTTALKFQNWFFMDSGVGPGGVRSIQ